jgi:hypothetical protein
MRFSWLAFWHVAFHSRLERSRQVRNSFPVDFSSIDRAGARAGPRFGFWTEIGFGAVRFKNLSLDGALSWGGLYGKTFEPKSCSGALTHDLKRIFRLFGLETVKEFCKESIWTSQVNPGKTNKTQDF